MPKHALIALLLLAALASAQQQQCTETKFVEYKKVGGFTYYGVSETAAITFDWRSKAMAWSAWGVQVLGGYLLSPLQSVEWEKPLEYVVTIKWIDSWDIGVYNVELKKRVVCCTTNPDGSKTCTESVETIGSTTAYKVESEDWREKEFKFVVGKTEVGHYEEQSTTVKRYRENYCKELPTVDTFPSCASYYVQPPNKASLSKPGTWKALFINGLKPGYEYSTLNIKVKIPDPYFYTDGGPDPVKLYSDLGQSGDSVQFWNKVDVKGTAVPRMTTSITFAPIHSVSINSPYVTITYGIDKYDAVRFLGTDFAHELFKIDNDRLAYIASIMCALMGPDSYDCIRSQNPWEVAMTSPAYSAVPVLYGYILDGPTFVGEGDFEIPYGSAIRFYGIVGWQLPNPADPNSGEVTTAALWTALADPGGMLSVYDNRTGTKRMWYQRGTCATVDVAVDEIADKAGGGYVYTFGGPFDAGVVNVQLLFTNKTVPVHWVSTEDYYNPIVRGTLFNFGPATMVYKGPVPSKIGVLSWAPASFIEGVGGPQTLYEPNGWGPAKYLGAANTGDPASFTPYLDVTTLVRVRVDKIDPRSCHVETVGVIEGRPYYIGKPPVVSSKPPPVAVSLAPVTACDTAFCPKPDLRVWGPVPRENDYLVAPKAAYVFYVVKHTWKDAPDEFGLRIYVVQGAMVYPPHNVEDYGRAPRDIEEAVNKKKVLVVDIPPRKWKPYEIVFAGPRWWREGSALSPCDSVKLGELGYYLTPDEGPVYIIAEAYGDGWSKTWVSLLYVAKPYLEIFTSTPAPDVLASPQLNMTALLWGVAEKFRYRLYHGYAAFGEGGRWREMACVKMPGANYPTHQAVVSEDFWGYIEAAGVRVGVKDLFSKPAFRIVDWSRGLVNITADGPVYGFAFYLQRGGKWVKVAEVAGRWVVVNASRIFPWDPVRVVPLVGQHLFAYGDQTVPLWRPQDRLLYKLWADNVGYPKGAQSELVIVQAGG